MLIWCETCAILSAYSGDAQSCSVRFASPPWFGFDSLPTVRLFLEPYSYTFIRTMGSESQEQKAPQRIWHSPPAVHSPRPATRNYLGNYRRKILCITNSNADVGFFGNARALVYSYFPPLVSSPINLMPSLSCHPLILINGHRGQL